MKCTGIDKRGSKKCGQELMVCKNKPVSEIDTTDVFMELTHVCVNPNCSKYAGTDLNNPKAIAAKTKHKVE